MEQWLLYNKSSKTLNTGSSTWIRGKVSLLWEWLSTGTGCTEILHSGVSFKSYLNAIVCNLLWWTHFRRRVGLNDLQKSVPTPTILWVCIRSKRKPVREKHGISMNSYSILILEMLTELPYPCSFQACIKNSVTHGENKEWKGSWWDLFSFFLINVI